MNGRFCGVLTAFWLATGCGTNIDNLEPIVPDRPVSAEIGAEFLHELEHIGTVFTLSLVMYIGLILGVTFMLRRALILGVRICWRLGWDPERRLARVRSFLELLILLVTALLLGRLFFRVIPVLSLLFVGFAGLLAAMALPGGVQDLVAGISLVGRQRFVEGDQVELAGHSGTVRYIGLVRTTFRLPDGRTLWLPNREIMQSAVHVGREQQAVPIDIPLPMVADDPEIREEMRRVVHLSPYRRAGSQPLLEQQTDGRWVLTFQTWATRRPEIVQRAVAHQLYLLGQAQEGV